MSSDRPRHGRVAEPKDEPCEVVEEQEAQQVESASAVFARAWRSPVGGDEVGLLFRLLLGRGASVRNVSEYQGRALGEVVIRVVASREFREVVVPRLLESPGYLKGRDAGKFADVCEYARTQLRIEMDWRTCSDRDLLRSFFLAASDLILVEVDEGEWSLLQGLLGSAGIALRASGGARRGDAAV